MHVAVYLPLVLPLLAAVWSPLTAAPALSPPPTA